MKGKWIGLTLLLLVVIGAGSLWLFASPAGKDLWERITGETPRAKVRAYVWALARADEPAALGLWELPALRNTDQLAALAERQTRVTAGLLAAGLHPDFTVLGVEWWGTCCEPRVIDDPRDAGGARMRVQLLDSQGLPAVYLFDIFVRDGPYWGGAMNYPLRQWVIRDIYPQGQEPLYWRLISKTTVESLEWKPTPAR